MVKKYDRASEFFGEALRLDQKLGNQLNQAQDLRFLALIAADTGRLEKGVELHKKALEIHKLLNNTREIAFDLANIGVIYKNLKDNMQAEKYFRRALIHFEELGMLGEEIQLRTLLDEN